MNEKRHRTAASLPKLVRVNSGAGTVARSSRPVEGGSPGVGDERSISGRDEMQPRMLGGSCTEVSLHVSLLGNAHSWSYHSLPQAHQNTAESSSNCCARQQLLVPYRVELHFFNLPRIAMLSSCTQPPHRLASNLPVLTVLKRQPTGGVRWLPAWDMQELCALEREQKCARHLTNQVWSNSNAVRAGRGVSGSSD